MTEAQVENTWPTTLLLASPRGFCAGVIRAIDTLSVVQAQNPTNTTYSYHEIIHNTHVVGGFKQSGVKFVDEINQIPEGKTVVLSAHGVSPAIRKQAQNRGLRIVDATCPLVEKTHREALKYIRGNYTILYIGHAGHDETIGTLGEAPDKIKLIQTIRDATTIEVPDEEKVALITQTTLSQGETEEIRNILRKRFMKMVEPKQEDICYATQNRQDGVRRMVENGAQVVITVGSPNSSNSQRLREVTEDQGAIGILIDDASELDPSIFFGVNCVGLTAGASAPDDKFQKVVDWFKARGSINITGVVVADESRTIFTLPVQLRKSI